MSKELPGLDDGDVQALASTWRDTGLWDDVRWLAERFWSAKAGTRQHLEAWHHLVLAVGNFKRDAGRRLHPARLALSAPTVSVQRPSLDVPGVAEVDMESRSGWEALSGGLPGAAVPTTTTLLAALWPERHFICDRLVFAAANGLRIGAGLPPANGVDLQRTKSPKLNFSHYEQVRGWVFDLAGGPGANLTVTERALYRLGAAMQEDYNARDLTSRSWQHYAEDLPAVLARAVKQALAPAAKAGS